MQDGEHNNPLIFNMIDEDIGRVDDCLTDAGHAGAGLRETQHILQVVYSYIGSTDEAPTSAPQHRPERLHRRRLVNIPHRA